MSVKNGATLRTIDWDSSDARHGAEPSSSASSRASPHRLAARHVALLLIASMGVRLLFLALVPAHTYSSDVQNWREVAAALAEGDNPYNVTHHLNWPPLWMQVVFVMHKLALAWGLDLATAIRLFLVSVESGVLIVGYALLRQFADPKRAFSLALYGVALNPIAVLLVCQHCNFDVVVGLFVLLALFCAIRFNESADEREWLYACGGLGLAVLAKSVPFVLVPLLGFGLRQVSWRSRVLGALLVLGPVTLGMSIVYALGPGPVTANVLQYRSASGWFGFTGFFEMAHWHRATELYTAAFTRILPLLLAGGVFVALRRGRATAEELALLGLGLLTLVPGLGPGYGPQYFYWFLPLIPVAFAATVSPIVRRALLTFMAVAIVTYVVEYAMFGSHGRFLFRLYPLEAMARASSIMSSRAGQTLIRTPLFIVWLLMLRAVFGRVRQSLVARSPLPSDAHPSAA
jgi:hypothetical protein